MGSSYATEWSDGRVIDLGGLPGSTDSYAYGINDAGQAVGDSRLSTVPEPSTWAMMLLGFAGLAFAGYRRSERVLGRRCVKTPARFHTDLFRSLFRALRASTGEEIMKIRAPRGRSQNFAEF